MIENSENVAYAPDTRCLRERQREARGEAILDAAFALIAERGYDALTMESVAARVGISRQTLYHHFTSKDDITLRAILRLMDQGIGVIESLDPALPALDRLQAVMRWMLGTRFQPTKAALVKVRHSLMNVLTHPEYQRSFERRAATIAEIVSAAQRAGDIRADLPPRLIVQMMLGLISDSSYEGLIAAGVVTPATVTDAVVELFFDGLGKRAKP